MTDPLLASLLMEHPFADDEGLLFTIDRSVTAGEARAAARTLADELPGWASSRARRSPSRCRTALTSSPR